MTYSLDFRQKVLSIKSQEKLTQAETAVRFRISVASIKCWDKQLEPQGTRNRPATKRDMEALEQDVKDNTAAYQYERAARFGVCQRAIGYETVKVLNNTIRQKTTLYKISNK